MTLRIDSLAFGGDGVGRLQGKVCFVPFAAPGDLLEVRVVEERPNYLRAEIVNTIEASRSRRSPRCRHFGRCGGCQWQHIEYPRQLAIKEKLLSDSMMRIGGIEAPIRPIVPSMQEYGYRTRARLHAGSAGFGYFERGSKRIVQVEECPILLPQIESRIVELSGTTGKLDRRVTEIELEADGGEGVVLRSTTSEGRRRSPGSRGKRPKSSSEDYSFRQVNHYVNLQLGRAVEEVILRFLPENRPLQVIDLYCGDGNLSLPLAAHGGSVEGFDTSEDSIRRASERSRLEGLDGAVYSRMDATAALEAVVPRFRGAAERRSFLCVIADPPRAGLQKIIAGILGLAPELFVYVSCNPPALARDSRRLCDEGMRLELLAPFDMFPQTFHLETMAVFSRSRRSEPEPTLEPTA